MKLLIGRYAGREIEDVPSGYIEWMLTCMVISNPDLTNQLIDELSTRGVSWNHEPKSDPRLKDIRT